MSEQMTTPIAADDIAVIIAGLLHDVGKVIYNPNMKTGGVAHGAHGKAYLEKILKSSNLSDYHQNMILEAAAFHHEKELGHASEKVDDNSTAYITYMADYVAASVERMQHNKEAYVDYEFMQTKPLESVFDLLFEEDGAKVNRSYYKALTLGHEDEINYPNINTNLINQNFYELIEKRLDEILKDIELSTDFVNSLLAVLEETLTYIPAVHFDKRDISLYDHLKMVAGLNSCIKQYMEEKYQGVSYKTVLYDNRDSFVKEKAFLLYSMDISGIQKFIYTIDNKDVLRNLRARSFYLEIMMEHIIDGLLDKLSLTRANALYAGGGHCYLVIPNTDLVKQAVKEYEQEIKQWLIKHYGTELYVGSGYGEASAQIFNNIPNGSYQRLFSSVSEGINASKVKRYSATDIVGLNNRRHTDRSRECVTCKRTGVISKNSGRCELCSRIVTLSEGIMSMEKSYFSIVKATDKENNLGLPLPGDCYLHADTGKALHKRMEDRGFVRAYAKNKNIDNLPVTTVIKVGNYAYSENNQPWSFDDFADKGRGIKRVGILRADVDNLGTAFSLGFNKESTLARTASLSRQLSLFFKYHLNGILQGKKAAVVYAGGDDLFIAGSWRDIIDIGMDIDTKFREYTGGKLTLSAGIGMYSPSYPISRLADEVGALESISKKMPGKKSVTLFPDGKEIKVLDGAHTITLSSGTYQWEQLRKGVIGDKYKTIESFINSVNSSDKLKGNSFLYKVLELLRQREDKISYARFAYMLARLEKDLKQNVPKDNNFKKQDKFVKQIDDFSTKMYGWMKSDEDSRQLITALYLYVYENRK
ncbi:MAG: type III-A CRISPR-associated protein Cas10/Csm1 [Lachnospiraceae bacterium]|nr:type III-A CRISPR-associated protein Cas10/Csm1 [Lachnospiraceae bacterium]